MIQGSGNRPMRASATLILATLMSCLPSISVAANPNAAQDTAPPAALKHALEEYEDRIDELTLSKGSSAFELAEEWVALGFARQRARDHRAAVDSFENALYIERLTQGAASRGPDPTDRAPHREQSRARRLARSRTKSYAATDSQRTGPRHWKHGTNGDRQAAGTLAPGGNGASDRPGAPQPSLDRQGNGRRNARFDGRDE